MESEPILEEICCFEDKRSPGVKLNLALFSINNTLMSSSLVIGYHFDLDLISKVSNFIANEPKVSIPLGLVTLYSLANLYGFFIDYLHKKEGCLRV